MHQALRNGEVWEFQASDVMGQTTLGITVRLEHEPKTKEMGEQLIITATANDDFTVHPALSVPFDVLDGQLVNFWYSVGRVVGAAQAQRTENSYEYVTIKRRKV